MSAPLTLKLKVSLVVVGVLLSLGILEVAYRSVGGIRKDTWNDRPSVYLYPQTSHSFQDYAYSQAKPPNTIRIAVVGDSFTYGPYLQFTDTFPKRLEQFLNMNQTAPRVEVMNAGVCGFSTKRELDIVRNLLSNYHPDRIILEITLNDPEVEPYRVKYHDRSIKDSWLAHKSKLYRYVATRISARAARSYFKRYYFSLFEDPATWNNFVGALDDIVSLTKSSGVALDVIIFPLFSHRIDDAYPFAPLHLKIQQALKDKGVHYLDLAQKYRNIPPERLQIIPGSDCHPNEIAHRMAAEAIYNWFKRQHTLPPSVFATRYARQRSDQMRGRLPI